MRTVARGSLETPARSPQEKKELPAIPVNKHAPPRPTVETALDLGVAWLSLCLPLSALLLAVGSLPPTAGVLGEKRQRSEFLVTFLLSCITKDIRAHWPEVWSCSPRCSQPPADTFFPSAVPGMCLSLLQHTVGPRKASEGSTLRSGPPHMQQLSAQRLPMPPTGLLGSWDFHMFSKGLIEQPYLICYSPKVAFLFSTSDTPLKIPELLPTHLPIL